MTTVLLVFLVAFIFVSLRRILRLYIDRPAGALITLVTVAAGVLIFSVEVRLAHGTEIKTAESISSPKTVAITPADDGSTPRDYRIVLICDTAASRQRGLQGFRGLKRDEAALFVFKKPQEVTFWMGSVAYPIDIIFIGPGKRVIRVYPECRPGSLEYYPSTAPVLWVIETAAGSGISAGDKVSFK